MDLTDDALTIKGRLRHQTEEKEAGEVRRRETRAGEFRRTLRLPTGVDADHVEATHEDGVLSLVLPKVEKTRRRTIKVA